MQRSPLPASMSSLSLNKSNDTVVVNNKPFNKTRFVLRHLVILNTINNFKYHLNRSPSEPQAQAITTSRGNEFTTPTRK